METPDSERRLAQGASDDSSPEESDRRFHPWITDELFAETKRVWSKHYEREIGDDEALEILCNVKRLAEAIMFSKRRNLR